MHLSVGQYCGILVPQDKSYSNMLRTGLYAAGADCGPSSDPLDHLL